MNPALHGLIDQLPEAWTVDRRDMFIAAFLLVLDISVDMIVALEVDFAAGSRCSDSAPAREVAS